MKHAKFRKTSLAAAIALVSGTMMLSGCNLAEGDSSTSTAYTADTTNVAGSLQAATGTIYGQVQDTNGHAIAGATVSAAGQTVTTDASGSYALSGVKVGPNSHLQVRVAPPAGYLAGTVTVSPDAYIIYKGNVGGAAGSSIQAIQGWTEQAGTAVLPAIGASFTGVLRNQLTQEPIANTRVALDLVSVGSNIRAGQNGANGNQTGQEIDDNDVGTSYATAEYIATTNAAGEFTFENLPEDSTYRLRVEGNWSDPNALYDTEDEDIVTQMGDVYVQPVALQDTVAPVVAKVVDVQDGGTKGILNRDATNPNTLVVVFSEQVTDEIDAGDLTVTSQLGSTPEAYLNVTSATLANDGRTLTIKLDQPLQQGADITVAFPYEEIQDLAGNRLSDGNVGSVGITYDGITGVYEKIYLGVTGNVETAGEVINLQRVNHAPLTDQFPQLANANDALVDVVNGSANAIQQLNHQDGQAAARLQALADQLDGDLNGAWNSLSTVVTNVAHATFDASKTGGYEVRLFDQNGVDQTNAFGVNIMVDGVSSPGIFSLAQGDTADVVVTGVQPGWTLKARGTDALGIGGAWATLSLTDNVEPTTVLQPAYGVGDDTQGGTALTYGGGAELVGQDGGLIPALPIFDVTPYLLSGSNANVQVGTTDSVLGNLTDGFANDVTQDAINNSVLSAFNKDEIYDADDYAGLNKGARIGVAFSEQLATVNGNVGYTGTNASLGQFSVLNDTTDFSGQPADVVAFDVDSVLDLAADQGARIDFTAAVTDTAGNAAGSDAQVIIEDKLPPFVTSATYNNLKLTVRFNEKTYVDVGQLELYGPTGTVVASNTEAGIADSANNYTLTLDVAAGAGATVPLDQDDFINVGTTSTPVYRAVLGFDTVEDAHGGLEQPNNYNTWSDYAGDFNAPQFLAVANLPPVLTGLLVTTNSVAGDSKLVANVDFAPQGIEVQSSVTASQLESKIVFTYNGSTIAQSNYTVSINTDGSFTLEYVHAVASGDTYDIQVNDPDSVLTVASSSTSKNGGGTIQ